MGKHAGNQGGRPRTRLNYKTLKPLCEILCTGEECAAIMEIDYEVLNNNLKADGHGGFKDYFKKYSSEGKSSLRRKQFLSALDGNVTMLIWLGKQHLDQKDKHEVESTIIDKTKQSTKYLETELSRLRDQRQQVLQ